jgi:hypothetical protein
LHNRVPMVASRIVVLLTLAVAALGVSRSAAAAPITWFITGSVTHSSGVSKAVAPVGTPFNLSVNFESTAPRPLLIPGWGYTYAAFGLSATLSFADFVVPYTTSNESFAVVNPSGGVEFFILGPTLPPGLPTFGAFSEIRLLTSTVAPNAATFGEAVGTPASVFVAVQGTTPNVEGSFYGSDAVVQQPTAVPEPATMTLFGTGLLAAWRARRKSM